MQQESVDPSSSARDKLSPIPPPIFSLTRRQFSDSVREALASNTRRVTIERYNKIIIIMMIIMMMMMMLIIIIIIIIMI